MLALVRTAALVLALVSVVLSAAACAEGNEPAAPKTVTWQSEGLSFEYPDSFAPGAFTLAASVPAGDCICRAVAPSAADEWSVSEVAAFRYDGDENSGLTVRVVETGDGAVLAPAAAGFDLTLQGLTDRLASPVGPGDQVESTTDGVFVFRSAGDATTPDGETVSQQRLTAMLPGTGRIYLVTCQFSPGKGAELEQACEDIFASATFDAGAST